MSPPARKRRLPQTVFVVAALLTGAAAASAEEPTPDKATVSSGEEVRLGAYALFEKDCSPGPMPTVRVPATPQHGVIVVRKGKLRTRRVADCPIAEGPASIVFYRAAKGFIGSDAVTFEVVNPTTGKAQPHQVAITVTGSL